MTLPCFCPLFRCRACFERQLLGSYFGDALGAQPKLHPRTAGARDLLRRVAQFETSPMFLQDATNYGEAEPVPFSRVVT